MFKWQREPQNLYNFSDKGKCIDNHVARTQSMFTYTGLPDNLNPRIIERYLQVNGTLRITEINDETIRNSGHAELNPGLYFITTHRRLKNV